MFTAIADPINFYYYNDPEFRDAWNNLILASFRYAATGMAFVAVNLDLLVNYSVIPVPEVTDFAVPVLEQMSPGSSLITALNSSANLNAEAANIPVRVSVSSSVPPVNVLFRNFTRETWKWGVLRYLVEYYALAMYHHYRDHPDWFLSTNAWRWLYLYWFMYDLDVHWHFFIGSLVYYDGFRAVFTHQDGILPLPTQKWPGATDRSSFLFPDYNISHLEQTNHPVMRNEFEEILRFKFGIPQRDPDDSGGGGTYDPPDCPNDQIIC